MQVAECLDGETDGIAAGEGLELLHFMAGIRMERGVVACDEHECGVFARENLSSVVVELEGENRGAVSAAFTLSRFEARVICMERVLGTWERVAESRGSRGAEERELP